MLHRLLIPLLIAYAVAPAVASASGASPGSPDPLPVLAAPRASDRILVVSPHPDDETIGAGGYIQSAIEAGATVRVVVATDGSRRGRKSTRHQETISALGKLGLGSENVTFLDYPDGNLSAQPAFQIRLAQIDAEFRPNIVIGTHPKDYHPDHAAVGRAIDALGRGSNHFTAYFFVVHYHRYPLPDGYRPDAEEVPAPKIADTISQWQNLPLAPGTEQAKCAAVLEYRSQLLRKNPLRRGLLISFIRKNEVFAVRSY